jgi:hypothetical protein
MKRFFWIVLFILIAENVFADSVKDYGAKGDGITNDTVAIQRAVNTIYSKGGGIVAFPPGKYLVTSINIREGITYIGEEATILRPPMQKNWTRTFTTQNTLYSGIVDSRPLVISNLIFDGNSQNQGPYQNYELAQAHLIFLMGNPNKPGRLKVVIDNCKFQNGVADGISVYKNVDLTCTSCSATNVFRGGLTITGGYSKVYLKQFVSQGDRDPTGIDVEPDSSGYNGQKFVRLEMIDCEIKTGDFDVGFNYASQLDKNILVMENCTIGPDLYSPRKNVAFSYQIRNAASVLATDCTFYSSGPTTGSGTAIENCHDSTFTRCAFIGTQYYGDVRYWKVPFDAIACVHIAWNGAALTSNNIMLFDSCKFNAASNVPIGIKTIGVYNTNILTQYLSMTFRNCEFGNLDYKIFNQPGSTFKWVEQ